MFSIPPPDNFWFFILKFSISLAAGVYLLNSYYRTKLLMINALLFFLIAIRACTEYYLPQVESFEFANNIAKFHALLLLFASATIWVSVYFYVRPFQQFKREDFINKIYVYGVLLVPIFVSSYWFILRRIHYFNPNKLDGYWAYRIRESIETDLYFMYAYVILSPLTIAILVFALYRDKKNRIRNTFLLAGYVSFTFIQKQHYLTDELAITWSIPNSAHLFLFHAVSLSWFVSGYRLFEDSTRSQATDLLNSISDIAISTTMDLKITFTNMLGSEEFGDVSGHLVNFLAGRSNALETEIETEIKSLLSRKESMALDLVGRDGSKGTYEIKSASLIKGGKELGYTFLFTDLTQERKRANELETMNKTKDQLFTIIAHDLRKPALAFKGIGKKIDYLIEKEDFTQLTRFTKAIDSASLNLTSVLDNLLNWARNQKGLDTNIQKISAPLSMLCNEVLLLFEGMIDNKALCVKNDINEDLTYKVDINAFQTMIRNLTDNAIKFSPAGSEIRWYSHRDDSFVYLTIQDEGIGMSKEEIIQFQSNKKVIGISEGRHEMSGTGLGLQLVRDIIDDHGGNLSVISDGHRGTRFTISLPVN